MSTNPSPDPRFAVDLVTQRGAHPLLTAVVAPTVEELEEDPGFGHFHFTRPEEDGVRIRLHLAAVEGASSRALREAAESTLTRYLGDAMGNRATSVSLRLDDDPVDPALYGGSVGLEICERQLELSSRTILDAMDAFSEWNAEHTLGVALPLHLGLAAAAGFDRIQAAAFFTDLARRRFPEASTVREEIERTFEATLEDQRAEIEPAVDLIWDSFARDKALGEPWADRFYVSMRNLTDELLHAHNTGHLDLPEERAWPRGNHLGTPCWPFGGLLFDQVHETDRRLGLGEADEIYLSHLLGELLRPA